MTYQGEEIEKAEEEDRWHAGKKLRRKNGLEERDRQTEESEPEGGGYPGDETTHTVLKCSRVLGSVRGA